MAAEVVIVCTGNSLVSAIHGDVGPTTDRKSGGSLAQHVVQAHVDCLLGG